MSECAPCGCRFLGWHVLGGVDPADRLRSDPARGGGIARRDTVHQVRCPTRDDERRGESLAGLIHRSVGPSWRTRAQGRREHCTAHRLTRPPMGQSLPSGGADGWRGAPVSRKCAISRAKNCLGSTVRIAPTASAPPAPSISSWRRTRGDRDVRVVSERLWCGLSRITGHQQLLLTPTKRRRDGSWVGVADHVAGDPAT